MSRLSMTDNEYLIRTDRPLVHLPYSHKIIYIHIVGRDLFCILLNVRYMKNIRGLNCSSKLFHNGILQLWRFQRRFNSLFPKIFILCTRLLVCAHLVIVIITELLLIVINEQTHYIKTKENY